MYGRPLNDCVDWYHSRVLHSGLVEVSEAVVSGRRQWRARPFLEPSLQTMTVTLFLEAPVLEHFEDL